MLKKNSSICSSFKIMGILNYTPDSFSDGDKYFSPAKAIDKINQLIKDGVNYIDIGGMASGPNSMLLSSQDELKRLEKLFLILKEANNANIVPISLDTFRVKVAESLNNIYPIKILNDISAMRYDLDMAAFVADNKIDVVLMYSKESNDYPLVSKRNRLDGDLIENIKFFFDERINFALKNNVNKNKIILDPGMGAFLSNSKQDSWDLIKRIDEILALFSEFRFLIGVSRKGFIDVPFEERDIHSKLIELYLINEGVHIIRTHEVLLLNKIYNTWRNFNQ